MKNSKVKQKCKFCGKKVLKSKICHIEGFPACLSCFEERKLNNYHKRKGITPKPKRSWLDKWVKKTK